MSDDSQILLEIANKSISWFLNLLTRRNLLNKDGSVKVGCRIRKSGISDFIEFIFDDSEEFLRERWTTFLVRDYKALLHEFRQCLPKSQIKVDTSNISFSHDESYIEFSLVESSVGYPSKIAYETRPTFAVETMIKT
jgi:hypothetical protein